MKAIKDRPQIHMPREFVSLEICTYCGKSEIFAENERDYSLGYP
jgi:hypothetical protein